jgi:hypothetical protein
MGTRVKLAIVALGALVIALSLLVPMVGPKPAPPPSVDQVTLQPDQASEQRAAGSADAVRPDRPRRRSSRDDRRPRATPQGAPGSKAAPNASPISRPDGVSRADATQPGRLRAPESPTVRPRSVSAPQVGGSPTPGIAPVRVNPPAPGGSPAHGDPAPDPPEPVDPPDPPEPVEEEATIAAADPPDQPEPADSDPVIETP